MKKVLYITANTKPEPLSSSRTVARQLVQGLQQLSPDLQVQELDLYTVELPVLQYQYFSGRSTLVGTDVMMQLPTDQQEDLAQINRLCDQFVDADIYVLAAPMWSLSYPAVVKQYLDCILMSGKTIAFEKEKPYGLLNDRTRTFVYVQSSGASLPWLLRPVLNKGMSYVEDMMRFIGIDQFYPLYVDGTGTTEAQRVDAVNRAVEKIPDLARDVLGI